MALWSNTADGWGSDPQKSGGGSLGTYLQSSLARAQTVPSQTQASDPTNTMPTASVSRLVATPSTGATAYASPFQSKWSIGGALTSIGHGISSAAGAVGHGISTAAGAVADAGEAVGDFFTPHPGQSIAGSAPVTTPSNTVPASQLGFGHMVPVFPDAATAAANEAQRAQNLLDKYTDYLTVNGTLPPATAIDLRDPADVKARQDALETYRTNKLSSDAIGNGIAPIDTSQQDAINRAAMSSLASAYGTNLGKGDIGNSARQYATAVVGQGGTNAQLSDEAYATAYNRNLAVFNQQVQNQATVDSSATGQKLSLDVQAMGDALAKLQQQASQLSTSAGQSVNQQLLQTQALINDYKAKAAAYGANTKEGMHWLKLAIGAAVSVASIAAAPFTGGASLAGVGAGVAVASS